MKAEFKDKLILTSDVENILASKNLIFPETRMELQALAMGGTDEDNFVVEYDIENHGKIVEATVTKCKNGVSVNYTEINMRRRDPDCLVVADNHDTDKARYFERYGEDFTDLRHQTFEWLKQQETLIIVPFMAGGIKLGFPALLIAPENAGFFAAGLADLQGFIPKSQIPDDFKPVAIIFLAPTFRHTHFKGEQVVVHNRTDEVHELFSFNLYPGPSAKKGVYGFLLHIGEMQGWLTLHGASVKLTTPYDNEFVMMHEGARARGRVKFLKRFVENRMEEFAWVSTRSRKKSYLFLSQTPAIFNLLQMTWHFAIPKSRPIHQISWLLQMQSTVGFFVLTRLKSTAPILIWRN